MLPQNREKVMELLNILTPLVIGKRREGFTCNCGAVHCGPGVAISIEPAGNEYSGQEAFWFVWRVNIQADETEDWSCGLSDFVAAHELDKMFDDRFGNRMEYDNPYQIEPSGSDRVHEDLPPAVRIHETDAGIFFNIDWGRDQKIAVIVDGLGRVGPQRAPATSEKFQYLLEILERLEPVVYPGGPEPVMPFEVAWILDYQEALSKARVADHVCGFGGMSCGDHRGFVIAETRFAFIKHPIKEVKHNK